MNFLNKNKSEEVLLTDANVAIQNSPGLETLDSEFKLSDLAFSVAKQYSKYNISEATLTLIFLAFEFLSIVFIGMAIFHIYLLDLSSLFSVYCFVAVATTLTYTIISQFMGNNSLKSVLNPLRYYGRTFLAWISGFGLLLAVIFLFKVSDNFSRVWLISWFVIGYIMIGIVRFLFAYYAHRLLRQGRIGQRVVIVGGGNMAADLIRAIDSQKNSGIEICGIFDDRKDERSPGVLCGYKKLGTVSDLIEFARIAKIDTFLVCLPISAEKRILSFLKKLWVLPVDIRLSAYNQKLRFQSRSYHYIGNVPSFGIYEKPIADLDAIVKRGLDITLSMLTMIILAPVYVCVAIAVKLDSNGPVFFKQTRYGFNNEKIEIYKFRSLYHDQQDVNASNLVTKNDPRVTRVGAFIRRTSLDEIPQFLNVLKGDLSLVGPRPHASSAKVSELDALYTEVVDSYYARHRVKPGITGWAQVNGWRGETDTKEQIINRVEYDLYYIENWSIWLDLYIIARTPFALVKMEKAY